MSPVWAKIIFPNILKLENGKYNIIVVKVVLQPRAEDRGAKKEPVKKQIHKTVFLSWNSTNLSSNTDQ